MMLAMTAAFCAWSSPAPQAVHSFLASGQYDLALSGGAQVTANPLLCVRSGNPGQKSVASFALPLRPGITITHMAFEFQYTIGFGLPGPTVVGANFTVKAAGVPLFVSPHYDEFPYSKSHPNYSQPVVVSAPSAVPVPRSGGPSLLEFYFENNDRNIQLLLPLVVNISCTGGPCAAPAPPSPPPDSCSYPTNCPGKVFPRDDTQTWQMNRSTIIMPCNNTGYTDPQTTLGWGIVDFDWSNHKGTGSADGWAKHSPMDDEEMLFEQVRS